MDYDTYDVFMNREMIGVEKTVEKKEKEKR